MVTLKKIKGKIYVVVEDDGQKHHTGNLISRDVRCTYTQDFVSK